MNVNRVKSDIRPLSHNAARTHSLNGQRSLCYPLRWCVYLQYFSCSLPPVLGCADFIHLLHKCLFSSLQTKMAVFKSEAPSVALYASVSFSFCSTLILPVWFSSGTSGVSGLFLFIVLEIQYVCLRLLYALYL